MTVGTSVTTIMTGGPVMQVTACLGPWVLCWIRDGGSEVREFKVSTLMYLN